MSGREVRGRWKREQTEWPPRLPLLLPPPPPPSAGAPAARRSAGESAENSTPGGTGSCTVWVREVLWGEDGDGRGGGVCRFVTGGDRSGASGVLEGERGGGGAGEAPRGWVSRVGGGWWGGAGMEERFSWRAEAEPGSAGEEGRCSAACRQREGWVLGLRLGPPGSLTAPPTETRSSARVLLSRLLAVGAVSAGGCPPPLLLHRQRLGGGGGSGGEGGSPPVCVYMYVRL